LQNPASGFIRKEYNVAGFIRIPDIPRLGGSSYLAIMRMLTLEQILTPPQFSVVQDYCRRHEALGLKHYLEDIRGDLEKQDLTPEGLYSALFPAMRGETGTTHIGSGWKITWPRTDRGRLGLIRFWRWPASPRHGHRNP
jgi:hypothetical protein